MATATKKMPITGDPDADQLLMDEPLALLLGMLLDQQVPMEWAFRGPATLKRRFGGELDAHAVAAMSEDDVVAVFCEKPAVHRFPAAMGRRFHGMCEIVVDKYDGAAFSHLAQPSIPTAVGNFPLSPSTVKTGRLQVASRNAVGDWPYRTCCE